jgi:putative oxidoreductase
MTTQDALSRALGLGLGAANRLQPLAPLVTRLVLAQTFVQTGMGKLQNLDVPTGLFTRLGIPFPSANAVFIGALEFVGGICLILGLGTRVFAALLSATMIVALGTAHTVDLRSALVLSPETNHSLIDLGPFVLLVFLGWLTAFGAGAISVDRFIGARLLGGARSGVQSPTMAG